MRFSTVQRSTCALEVKWEILLYCKYMHHSFTITTMQNVSKSVKICQSCLFYMDYTVDVEYIRSLKLVESSVNEFLLRIVASHSLFLINCNTHNAFTLDGWSLCCFNSFLVKKSTFWRRCHKRHLNARRRREIKQDDSKANKKSNVVPVIINLLFQFLNQTCDANPKNSVIGR